MASRSRWGIFVLLGLALLLISTIDLSNLGVSFGSLVLLVIILGATTLFLAVRRSR